MSYNLLVTYPKENGQEQKRVFDTASRYHFIHTLALLGLPMCRMPIVVRDYFILLIII